MDSEIVSNLTAYKPMSHNGTMRTLTVLALLIAMSACTPTEIDMLDDTQAVVLSPAAASGPPPWVGSEPVSMGPVTWDLGDINVGVVEIFARPTNPNSRLGCHLESSPVLFARRVTETIIEGSTDGITPIDFSIHMSNYPHMDGVRGSMLVCESVDYPFGFLGIMVWPKVD